MSLLTKRISAAEIVHWVICDEFQEPRINPKNETESGNSGDGPPNSETVRLLDLDPDVSKQIPLLPFPPWCAYQPIIKTKIRAGKPALLLAELKN